MKNNKSKIKIITGILILIIIIITLVILNKNNTINNSDSNNNKILVSASFYPLVEFARQVGGDFVSVQNITKDGISPHDYTPTAQDIKSIYDSKILLYNGAGLDIWAEKISFDLINKGVIVTEITKDFTLLESVGDEHHEEVVWHAEEHEDEHIEDKKQLDPHIWLDPILAIQIVETVKDTLIKADSKNSDIYINNATKYIAELNKLNELATNKLASCQSRDIIASHGAFAYLAKRYNINVINIAGLSPSEEPSPKKLAEITKLAKEKGIKYIFFEELVSDALANTIAKEINAKTIVVNPMEGLTRDEILADENYITIMTKNINNIATALSCKN